MKKIDVKNIVQAVILERISPMTYSTVCDYIKHRRTIQPWEKQQILTNFGLPMITNRMVEKQYKHVISIIKTRMDLDKAISTINRQMPEGYRPARQPEEYEDEYDDYDDEEEDDY